MSFRVALWAVVLAKAVSFFGDQVVAVALVLRVQASGSGAFAVAGILMAELAPIALLAGPAGRLVDRCGSRVLLVTSGAFQGLVCTALIFASSTAGILPLVALLGAGQAVTGATSQALLPTLVSAQRLPRALGLSQAANTLGLIAAPAVAGLLTATAGTRWAIAVDAATFAGVIVAGLVAPDRRAAPASGRQPGGLAIVRRDPLLAMTVLTLGLFVLLGAVVNVVDVFLVRDTLGASPFWYGLAGAAYAVGVFGGALAGGRLTGTPALIRAFLVSAGLLGVGLLGMGLSPSVAVLVAVSVATGAANGVLSVATSALIFGGVAADERGRVGALVSGVASVGQLGAYAAGGALASVLAPRTIFVLAGVLGALVPLVMARRLRASAHGPAPVREAEAVA